MPNTTPVLPTSTWDRMTQAAHKRLADHAAGGHTRPLLGCPKCG